jgi:ribosome modulation factor
MGAREEGYKAYKTGKNVHDNPYEEEGSFYSNYNQWEEGWHDAEAEDEDYGEKGTEGLNFNQSCGRRFSRSSPLHLP